jgi:hypothetical protein
MTRRIDGWAETAAGVIALCFLGGCAARCRGEAAPSPTGASSAVAPGAHPSASASANVPPATVPAGSASATAARRAPVITEPHVWFVDQPSHGSYESTCYTLRPDGSLGRASVLSRETGTVTRGHDGPRCTFGDRWDGDDTAELRVELACSDGVRRSLTLDFSSRPGNPTVRDVDGEPGWSHTDFTWHFRRCSRDAKATPGDRCCEGASP